MRIQCGCVWRGERCENAATAEDGLCNWCAPYGARTEDELRDDPKAMITPDGSYHGIGGAGQTHDAPHEGKACWQEGAQRSVALPSALPEQETPT